VLSIDEGSQCFVFGDCSNTFCFIFTLASLDVRQFESDSLENDLKLPKVNAFSLSLNEFARMIE